MIPGARTYELTNVYCPSGHFIMRRWGTILRVQEKSGSILRIAGQPVIEVICATCIRQGTGEEFTIRPSDDFAVV